MRPGDRKFQGAIVSDGKKKVMIGVPMHKGEVTASTMMSVTLAQSQILEVNFHLLGLSLLAKNFNLLFIEALKLQCDYFLLHHSDLGVQGSRTNFSGSWVDLMVDRLNENELVALSAVVPIKSRQGFTSSGLEMKANDPWSLRRLTILESETLPLEYINRADLCELFKVDEDEAGALLINTGCLLMDIRKGGGVYSELKWPGFNIIDFIAWNQQGIPASYTVPEDWNFSNWLHDNDLPYACTRELVVAHIGQENYMNMGLFDEDGKLIGWGEPADVNRQQPHPDVWRGERTE